MTAAYPQVGTRGTGRRKNAIARVRLIKGKGVVLVNGRPLRDYLNNRRALEIPVLQPLVVAGAQEKYNVLANVNGGGIAGQADAIKLGIARALADTNEEYEQLMRKEGFLTRDPRAKESKKYGRKKARKRFQYSKR